MVSSRMLGAVMAGLMGLLVSACGSHTTSAPIPEGSPTPTTAAPRASPAPASWRSVSIPIKAYRGWRGTMTDVRPWSAAEAAALRDRVRRAGEQSWTAAFEIDHLPIEVAHTPRHDRVRLMLPSGKAWWAEVHLLDEAPPNAPGGALPIVVCTHGQYGPQCQGLLEDRGPSDDPFLDGAVTLGTDLATRDVPHLLLNPPAEPDRVFLARVDSPAGPLDCVVEPPDGVTLLDLEGGLLIGGPAVAPGYGVTCVDGRGLVLVRSGAEAIVRPLIEADPTLHADITTYPAEVDGYLS